MINKIQSYLGFAKKSGSIIYGLDNLEKYRKCVYLVLYSDQLSENSYNKLKRLVNERKWRMGALKGKTLDDLLMVNNCKVVGLTNESLAKAIVLANTDSFIVFEI